MKSLLISFFSEGLQLSLLEHGGNVNSGKLHGRGAPENEATILAFDKEVNRCRLVSIDKCFAIPYRSDFGSL